MTTFYMIEDDGHGWLVVPREEADALDLNRASFTECSFYKAETFYLEEDCDLAIFLAAFHRKMGFMPEIKDGARVRGGWQGRQYPRCIGAPDWQSAHAYLHGLRAAA